MIKHASPSTPRPTSALRMVKNSFAKLDLNHDGYLRKSEIYENLQDHKVGGDEAILTSVLFKHRHKLNRISRLSNDSWGPEGSRVSQTDLELSLETDLKDNFRNDIERARHRQNRQSKELFARGLPSMEKVTQGSLSDCWLIASIASLVDSRPEELKSAIQPLADGRYDVTLPDGKHQTVDAPTPTELITFANSGADGQWLSVLEKAHAQQEEGPLRDEIPQFVLEGGTISKGINTVTGNSSQIDYLPLTSLKKVERNLQAHLAHGDIVVAASHPGLLDRLCLKDPDSAGIISNHSYSVLSYEVETRELTLRNPWGEEDAIVMVPLNELRSSFSSISYEQRPPSASLRRYSTVGPGKSLQEGPQSLVR